MKKQMIRFLMYGMLAAGSALAGDYKSPQWNHCIESYYNPSNYNWLTFENRCGERLSVTFVWGNGGGGEVELSYGKHKGVGETREEVREKGGYETYVCPADYIPVGTDDRMVTRKNQQFRCKRY